MRFALADPPYPGNSRKYYKGHVDYDGEVDHEMLIWWLERRYTGADLDGWALCTGANKLQEVLRYCPKPISRGRVGGGIRYQFRILAWVKPMTQPGGRPGPAYGWEPVIMRGGRQEAAIAYPRDWIECSPDMYTFRRKPDDYVVGAKPRPFLEWVFRCLGAQPGDQLEDLFRGSGAVGEAWEGYERQLSLYAVGGERVV